ncbi:uncharacterized protein LOC116849163 isoform X2 [Odontomachus brunneus]|uniref:uncharacterized protein LOC116849163 isoform X2 n=1 Tax=Odontomachus brunneus TaxID=486640 RepID=UPI0013F25D96|nr:uncharacterized protein LOC116849163 isoform X2 [Odontomachus brunneus]XP_032681949.1 uncharacterized protein LOC116849163 isoform X2 [Odontomachus brunneus]XP_032681950.1 uncharacterized protein LOC116849163 isoform X2 [Odontomachus brunneus]
MQKDETNQTDDALKYREYEMGTKIVSSLLSVLMLNILWTAIGYAAPLLNERDLRDVSTPVTKCFPNEQCWEWLSTLGTRGDTVLVTDGEDSDISKLQSRRQIMSPASEFALKSWPDITSVTKGQVIRSSASTNKQIPVRITKKEMSGSRSWGAGGMPFSVLYMNPHHSRPNTATAKSTTQRTEPTATVRSSSSPPIERPNQRKRQPTVQPRRQFLTIPQLFISYGWDAYGK